MTERLKEIKKDLISCVESQMGDLKDVETKELGEVIDMIKDLEEAIYYCTVTEAMEGGKENYPTEVRNTFYYTEPKMYTSYPSNGRMMSDTGMTAGGRRGYTPYMYLPGADDYMPAYVRDYREGRSPASRKSYMESKEMHKDKATQMEELEHYLNELSTDMAEMIQNATPEEKMLLQQKISNLANSIK